MIFSQKGTKLSWIASAIKNAKNDGSVINNPVINGVRETLCQQAMKPK
jgi:hypothetical protein